MWEKSTDGLEALAGKGTVGLEASAAMPLS